MEQRLKEILNSKLRGLPLTDAMPDFDKDELWAQLSGRLAPKQRRAIPLAGGWKYAAAAVLVGLLIGGGILKYLAHDNVMDEPTAFTKVHSDQSLQRSTPHSDTSARLQPDITSAAKNSQPVSSTHAPLHLPHAKDSLQTIAIVDSSNIKAQQTAAQEQPLQNVQVAQTNRQTTPRAIHLLDLESEDQTALIDNEPSFRTGYSFSFYISPKRLPDGRDALVPASVLGPIVH